MLTAKGNHPCHVVVLPLVPRRIEVMPREVWASTPFDRATKADFLCECAANVFRWGPVHPNWWRQRGYREGRIELRVDPDSRQPLALPSPGEATL
jgi:hypothetical protein